MRLTEALPGADDAADPFESVWGATAPPAGTHGLWYEPHTGDFLAPTTDVSPYEILGIADPSDLAADYPDLWQIFGLAQGTNYTGAEPHSPIGRWHIDVTEYQDVLAAEVAFKGRSHHVGPLPDDRMMVEDDAAACFGVSLSGGAIDGKGVVGRAWAGDRFAVELFVASEGDVPTGARQRAGQFACDVLQQTIDLLERGNG